MTTLSLIVGFGIKSVLIAALTLLMLRLLRARSAAQRSAVASAGIVALCLFPLAGAVLPALTIPQLEPVERLLTKVANVPGGGEGSTAISVMESGGAFPWETLFGGAYWSVAALLFLGFAAGMFRLRRIVARSEVLTAPHWLSALAQAQHRIGLKHGTALLVSDEIRSPISWGVARPTIVLNPSALSQSDYAESIIAHELAHVARLDWGVLLLGRLVQCVYWFNPLAWVLTREALHLAEEAADDAALRGGQCKTDYANLLLLTVRHAHNPAMLPAQGVAPGRSSLSRRIAHVLDLARPRLPAPRAWVAGCLALAVGTACAVSVAAPVSEARREPSVADARKDGPVRYDRPTSLRVETLLYDNSAEIRARAARMLGDFGTDESAVAIARLLDDPVPNVRLAAAHALGDLGSPATEPALRRALNDSDPAVRAKAKWALGELIELRVAPGG